MSPDEQKLECLRLAVAANGPDPVALAEKMLSFVRQEIVSGSAAAPTSR